MAPPQAQACCRRAALARVCLNVQRPACRGDDADWDCEQNVVECGTTDDRTNGRSGVLAQLTLVKKRLTRLPNQSGMGERNGGETTQMMGDCKQPRLTWQRMRMQMQLKSRSKLIV